MMAAESSFSVLLSGERMLRTQTSPCGKEQSACSRSCSPRNNCTCSPTALIELHLARESCFERLRAPGAEMPEIRVDAPPTMRATRAAAGKLPRPFGLRAAPRAVAHERHQRPAAASVATLSAVAFVGVTPRRFDLKTRAITRRAIVPVRLYTAV